VVREQEVHPVEPEEGHQGVTDDAEGAGADGRGPEERGQVLLPHLVRVLPRLGKVVDAGCGGNEKFPENRSREKKLLFCREFY
jgi:hypothetical protein